MIRVKNMKFGSIISATNEGYDLKPLNIEHHYSIVKFIRVHTNELYLGYKTFIVLLDNDNDTHFLITLVAELESSFTQN